MDRLWSWVWVIMQLSEEDQPRAYAAISKLSALAHSLLFDIPFDAHLSATGVISWQRTLLIPILGGVVLASIAMFFAGRLKGQQLADAIEANALYGGRMSLNDGILVMLQAYVFTGMIVH